MDPTTALSYAAPFGLALAAAAGARRRIRPAGARPGHRPRPLRRPTEQPPAPAIRPTGGDSRLPVDGLWLDPDPNT